MPEKDDDDDFGFWYVHKHISIQERSCSIVVLLVDARACRNTFITKTHRIC